MGSLLAITRNTFLETLRQPIFALVLTISCMLIALMPATAVHLFTFTKGSNLEHIPERMIADLGLATAQLAGLVVAIFVTTSVISREIDQKTAATVLSKPVGRGTFIIGKYLGVSLGITALCAAASITTLLTIRVGSHMEISRPIDTWVIAGQVLAALLAVTVATYRNYSEGRSWIGQFNLTLLISLGLLFLVFAVIDRDHAFTLAPGYEPKTRWILKPGRIRNVTYDWQVVAAAIMTIESVLILVAVSVCASTRLRAVGNASVTFCLFVLGLTSQFIQSTLNRQDLSWLGWPLRLFFPDLERFWLSDALIREQTIPLQYLIVTSAYALCFIVAYLALAAWLFDERDVA